MIKLVKKRYLWKTSISFQVIIYKPSNEFDMKTFLPLITCFITSFVATATPGVNLTTYPLASSSVNQGTTGVVVYIVKMKVTTEAVTINNIQYTLSGTNGNNDFSNTYTYFNTFPTLTGATYLGGTSADYAAPQAYSYGVNKTLNPGDSGYYIITVNLTSDAKNGNNVKVTGASTPVVFTYSTAVNLSGSQTNGATVTIEAANVKLSPSPTAAASVNQGTTGVLVYAVKMKVTTQPTTVSSISYILSGTHDANDLSNTYVYYNTLPTLTGATYLGGATANYAAPHTYNVGINKPMAVGDTGYFMVTVNVTNTASNAKTIRVISPVEFFFNTAPTVTGSQTSGGLFTITGANVKVSSTPLSSINVNQGTTGVLVYAVKMKVTTQPVTVNGITYNLSGNHDANDLTNTYVYYNSSNPNLTGATYLGGDAATYTSPHTHNVGINKAMALGDSGYFIITVNVSATANDTSTVQLHGNVSPVTFTYTTDPKVTNTQSDGDIITIRAANIKVSTQALPAATVNQGTTGIVVYMVKMKVSTQPVTVNGISYTLSGTQDANDLTNTYAYFNTSPSLSGATYLGGGAANYAAPQTYSYGINRAFVPGDSGYFMITVNVSATATDSKTIKVNGAATPVSFTYNTAPNVSGSQSNGSTITIKSATINVTTFPVTGGDVNQGSNTVLIYAVKAKATGQPLTINGITYTLDGTHNGNDLTNTYVYFNSIPTLTGSTYLGGGAANYAAPQSYTFGINKMLAAGDSGYFFITVNVHAKATDGKTIKVTGSTAPVTFSYNTDPKVTGKQTNGTTTIIQAADMVFSTFPLAAGSMAKNSTGNIVYIAKAKAKTQPATVNSVTFNLGGTHDNNDLTNVYVYFNTLPTLTGATYHGGLTTPFAGPHTYKLSINKTFTPADTGYFLFVVNVAATANGGHTVKVDGASKPVVFGFTTAPNITNNQTDNAGVQTISGAPFAKPANEVIRETFAEAIARVYPNPVRDKAHIVLPSFNTDAVTVIVLNTAGKVMMTKVVTGFSGRYLLNTNSLPKGAYYLIADGKDGTKRTLLFEKQ